jgi:predicted O-linked N-acetylglucosamine transferase (SPINDLY family)
MFSSNDSYDILFTIRSFPQEGNYSRVDEIAASLRKDQVDVVITEQNRSIAAALFAQRVAPLQIWADTGFPFWGLQSLDWTLSPAASGPPDMTTRKSRLTWRQDAATLKSPTDLSKVAAIRRKFPEDVFILGVFVRLVKLNETFLRFLGKLLAAEPAFRLIIAGTGHASAVQKFMTKPEHARRITFLHENVDLNIYAQVIDVMCDSFPFIGGNACREVAAHGTPVVSMLGTAWDTLLRDDRSPDLLATDMQGYIDRVKRLYRDHEFRDRQRQIALNMFEQQIDPKRMIDDVEAAIAAAGVRRNAVIGSLRL